MKKTFRKAMISTIAMLVVGVMSLTGVTYAWFTQGTTGQVTGMQMTVTSAAGGVQISEDETSWASILPLTTSATQVNPVSTVGGNDTGAAWSFFTAAVSETNSKMIMTDTSVAGNYIKQKLYIKNDNAAELKLALGKAGTEGKMTSITENNTEYNGHLASRLGIQLIGAKQVPELGGAAVTTGASVAGGKWGILEPNAATHLAGAGEKVAYNGVKAASKEDIVTDGETTFDGYFDMTSSNETYLAAVTTNDNATTFEIVIPAQTIIEIDVYVWLEGQDSDCTNAISSSALKVDLVFEVVA